MGQNQRPYWKKHGIIIKPQKRLWWMQTHAFVPFAEQIDGPIFKVYFSGRDQHNRSHIGYAIIDIENSSKVLEYSLEPVLTIGELGCFDDSGVTPSWIINHNGIKYLYYIGWNRRSSVRMGLITGLALSKDNGKTFKRVSRVPILERSNEEPYNIITGPSVILENNTWKMWYVSCVGWVNEDLPKYNIKYATSSDGINWHRDGTVAIDFKSLDEHSLARPSVLKDKNIYKMWYSYKGNDYRIGYAESNDGINWERMDNKVSLDVSLDGKDSEMIGITHMFKYEHRMFSVYNGNNYGIEGVMLAEYITK